MTIQTATDIDEAVPVDGVPSRALVNAVLKEILALISYLPDDGTIPIRSTENEFFSGGRLKTAFATDPDDCINLQQLQLLAASAEQNGVMTAQQYVKMTGLPAFRLVDEAPATVTSPGQKFDMYLTTDYLYICVAENDWRSITLAGWE